MFREWADLDRRVWRMAWARAINTAGMSLVMSFLGIYIVADRGYPAWLYGLCALGANVAQSMTNAWAGDLSDRIGRRALITGSLVIRAGVIALLGAQILLDAPLWTLALNFVASSALRGCFEPVAYALVSDVVAPHQRIAAFGLQRMGTNFGWALGPAFGGLLAQVMPYGAVFFLAALGLLLAAWTTTGVPESRATAGREVKTSLREAFREAFRQPVMIALLLASFLFSLVHTQLFSTFSIYLAERLHLTRLEIGLVYMINGAGVLLVQLAAIRLIHRIGIARALIGASMLFVIGYFAVGLAEGFASAAAAVAIITAAEVVFAPAHQTAASETGDADRRGRTFGIVGFCQILGVACAPLLGGSLFDALGDHHVAMWGVIAAVAAVNVVVLTIFAALRRRSALHVGG